MDQSWVGVGKIITSAAEAYESRRRRQGRQWVGVYVEDDKIVLALHGALTIDEASLSVSRDGAERVREAHRRQLAALAADLLAKIVAGIEDCTDCHANTEPDGSPGMNAQGFFEGVSG